MDDTLATIKIFEKIKNDFSLLSDEKKELINFIFTKSTHKSFKKYLEIFDIKTNILTEENFIKIIKKIVKKIIPESIKKVSNKNINSSVSDTFKSFSKFETRENQLLMSDSIDDSLKNNKKIVIEAPT
jgi:hypothetical protein